MTPSNDLDTEVRNRLADAVAAEAVFDGWTRTALQTAAAGLQLPEGEATRLFPKGPIAVLAFVSERADLRTVADMEAAEKEEQLCDEYDSSDDGNFASDCSNEEDNEDKVAAK